MGRFQTRLSITRPLISHPLKGLSLPGFPPKPSTTTPTAPTSSVPKPTTNAPSITGRTTASPAAASSSITAPTQIRRASRYTRTKRIAYPMRSSRLAEGIRKSTSDRRRKVGIYRLVISCSSEAGSSKRTMACWRRRGINWHEGIMSWGRMMGSGMRVSSRRMRCSIGCTIVTLPPWRETVRRSRPGLPIKVCFLSTSFESREGVYTCLF